MGTRGNEPGRSSKVARLIDQYDLDGLGDELEERWTTDDDTERLSLRDLADYFNRQLLQTALEAAGTQPYGGEVENVYRLLADDGVNAADRTRVERRLERQGVDADELRADFVSYQAIRTYLTNHRDAEYAPRNRDQLESTRETIQRLRNRTASVTEAKVERLAENGHLNLGTPRVTVDVRVFCDDCGQQFDVGTLLDRGRCDCPPVEA